jgi:hypothetical protein
MWILGLNIPGFTRFPQRLFVDNNIKFLMRVWVVAVGLWTGGHFSTSLGKGCGFWGYRSTGFHTVIHTGEIASTADSRRLSPTSTPIRIL